MNDPPSDVNENVIDIFVLSVSETVVPLFTEHLEKKGYRVTLFTDGTYLLETLRTGKPNLLICDTTTLDEEGYEVCRQIKADDDFWVIPVLILTSASTLTDLLHVLDCNADNFIPHPFDLSYSLSIIESMLGTPVERQTPDQIKTQFKISHDDRIYVVAANRRKLLEFLLSSFEIAVNKSSELSHVKTELQTLSGSAMHLEDCVTEQTRLIDTLKTGLYQKEQKILALTHEVEEKKKLLTQKTDEIEQYAEKLDHHKALITTFDGNIRSLTQEKKDIETAYRSEIDTLRQQISELLNELNTTKTNLDAVRGDLEEEKVHCTSLECTLELLVQQKEGAEKSLRSLTADHEELISALEAEKNRVTCTEQELTAVMQAKTQSEQELTQVISGLNETKNQQSAELTRLEGALEEESCQRISAENQVTSLRQDKEQLESSLRSLTADHEQLISALEAEKNRVTCTEQELTAVMQAKTQSEQELTQVISGLNETKNQQSAELTRLEGALEEESCQRISAENQVTSLRQDKEQSESSLRSLTADHEQLKSAFKAEENRAASAEKEFSTLMQAKTQTEQELTRAINDLSEINKQQAADLTRMKDALETEINQRLSSEEHRRSLQQDKEQSESSLQSAITALKEQLEDLRMQLETTRTALENEENTTKLLKENLDEAVAENEKTEARVKDDLESYKATFIRLKHDLDEATSLPKTLERDLDALKIQNKALANELNQANQGRAQSDQQVGLLTDELEKVKTAFDTERSLHQAGDKNIEALMQTMQRMERDLRTAVDERDKLNEILENERRLRRTAEDTTKAAVEEQEHLEQELRAVADEQAHQENERALKIQNLEKEFELVSNLQKSLEEEVNILTREKILAEETIKSLTDELDQARKAIADEWVDHMTLEESLAGFSEEPPLQKQSVSVEEAGGIKKEQGQEIIGKETDIQVMVESSPHALTMVTTPETQKSPASENELTPPKSSPGIQEVSQEGVTDSVKTFSDEDLFEENEPAVYSSEKEEALYPDAGQKVEETAEEPGIDSTGKISDESERSVPPVFFSFNRKQWFDLLKWAHHTTTLSHDQRLQIVRMGRLIQKDRKLTRKQEEQVREMIALVQSLGYRPS